MNRNMTFDDRRELANTRDRLAETIERLQVLAIDLGSEGLLRASILLSSGAFAIAAVLVSGENGVGPIMVEEEQEKGEPSLDN